METISQMATSAAKYAFGDSSNNQEPLSGTRGDVSKGEPYDAGNLANIFPPTDPSDQDRIRQGLNSTDPRGDLDSSEGAYTTSSSGAAERDQYRSTTTADSFNDVPKTQNTGPITTATNATDQSGFTHPQHDMSAPGRRTSDEHRAGGVTPPTNRTTDSGFTSPGQDMGGERSSAGLDATTRSTAGLDTARFSSGLDADRSSSGLDKTGSQDVHNTSTIDSKSKDSKVPSAHDDEPDVDVSGPGPRDLSTVAKENGGDAGNSSSETTSHTSGNKSSSADAAGGGGAPNELPQDTSDEKGTGELHVKSSGLQADGGDFDATKPGAGREADRLMEQKGLSPAGAAAGAKDHTSNNGRGGEGGKAAHRGGEEKEKHSLVDKIKEKLHKH
ncbi:hypothetical protein PWT90_10141 [Aphanocladium album]|nr:hypothetical protein PWT90_10141 [Aphanocladium album]